jgi:hypothetical protein
MDSLWTWGGEYFGYRVGDQLFTYHGIQAGRFDGDEVYGSDGCYLGEIKSDSRLISPHSKKGWRHSGFAPVRSGASGRYCSYADFPSPEEFR